MAIDWDGMVIGQVMGAFATPVMYTPMVATLDAAGRPEFNADGTPVVTPGPEYSAQGVFDEAYIEVTPAGAGPFSSTDSMEFGAVGGITEARPVLGVQLSAMKTAPGQEDLVLINSRSYVVKEVQPDGHGWALLLLNLAP